MTRDGEAADSGEWTALNRRLENVKLPTLPAVAQKLVELCKDENAAFAQFARVIESDPGLASRLLQVTNSAYYGLRNKVTTLERAIGVLGLKYVKMTSLGFRLATTLSASSSGRFDLGDFWEQSLLRGVLARQLARQYCPARPDEAFLVGLLQNCGIPVLMELLGEPYLEMWRSGESSQASLYRLEREMFDVNHVQVAAVLTEQWSLPELLAAPIRNHHQPGELQPSTDEMRQLSQMGYFVGTLSWNKPAALSEDDLGLPEYAQRVFGLERKQLGAALERARQEFGNVAQLFGEILPDRAGVDKLVRQAHALLAGLSAEAVHNIFVLEEEVKRLRARCAGLTSSVDDFAKQAEKDDLTGLLLRAPLDRFLDNACWRVKSGETTLTVIFLDVDNFKDINNNHSHAAGDRVLQDLAMVMRGLFGEGGCVARYGGDEFVAALMGLPFRQALQLARGLVEKVRETQVPVRGEADKGAGLSISCSVGMLFCEAGAKPGNGARVMELADQQMYMVKRRGKNDVRFQVMSADESNPHVSQEAIGAGTEGGG